jgi:mono/diheme cytochrome c family protein
MGKIAHRGFLLTLFGVLVVCTFVAVDFPKNVKINYPTDTSLASKEYGEFLLGLAGCVNCHTDPKTKEAQLAGGRELKTPFGIFIAPNISSDPEHGIGSWSNEDFIRALRHGQSPDGKHYFPAFPYVAYTRMTDADMLAIQKAIMARPPQKKPNKKHSVNFPFNQRWGISFWKLLHFTSGSYEPEFDRSSQWNRGAYIAEAVAHCGECHTPRVFSGGLDRSMWMAGVKNGPEGETAPNLTQDSVTGLGEWSSEDISFLLTTGLKINGDVVGSIMYEVIEHGTSKLDHEDVAAVVEYLKSLAPIHNPDAPAAQGF